MNKINNSLLNTNLYFREKINPELQKHKAAKCDITSSKSGLTVHHVNVSFSELLHESFEINNIKYQTTIKGLNQQQLNDISDTLIKLHQKKAQYVTLTIKMHRKYHKAVKTVSIQMYKLFKILIKTKYNFDKNDEMIQSHWKEIASILYLKGCSIESIAKMLDKSDNQIKNVMRL